MLLRQHVNTMASKLWKIECDPVCGFLIRSHAANEVYDSAVRHCKSVHSKVITLAEAKGMATPA